VFLVLLAGLFAGLGLAFFTEYCVDHTFNRPEQAESRVRVPVLVSVPNVRGRSRLTLPGGGARQGLLPAHGASSCPQGEATWSIDHGMQQHYEMLAHGLLAGINGHKNGPYLLGITSCYSGEGVSTVAAGLALTLANNGDGHVLLVDANFGSPSSARLFDGKNDDTQGVVDIQEDDKGNTIIIQPNLYALSAAEVNGNGPRLRTARHFAELIDHFRDSRYEFVVFDLPPVMEVASTLRHIKALDGVIMVVEAQRTRREAVQRARDLLEQAHVNIHGIVLNKRRYHLSDRMYGAL
jgi:capsular exopolysaccharide synthesis family protein